MIELSLGSLIGPALTAIAGLVSVVLTNRMTYNRSNKEKVWDLKRQAYGVILSELSALERACNVVSLHIEEDAPGYLHSDARYKHERQIGTHVSAVRERFSDNFLILSEAFTKQFETLLEELKVTPPGEEFFGEHEHFRATVLKNRLVLLALARNEVTPQRSRFRKPWL